MVFSLTVFEALQFLIVFILGGGRRWQRGGPPSSTRLALCLCYGEFLQLGPTPHANKTG